MPRIFAFTAIIFLAAYGIAYLAAAILSLSGGAWMQGVQDANRILAFALVAAALALATPLGDPMRLATDAQVARLDTGPDKVDFASLAQSDARYGYDALKNLARNPMPAIAGPAAAALAAAPVESLPPTQIGANITVRTPGARLPDALLTADWSGSAVPPCLTRPAQSCDAWFLDVDGDGRAEIVLVYGDAGRWWATAMKSRDGAWSVLGSLASPCGARTNLAALRAGHFALAASGWRDLMIGPDRLRFSALPGSSLCH